MSEAGFEPVIPLPQSLYRHVMTSTPGLNDFEAANLLSKQAGTMYNVTCPF